MTGRRVACRKAAHEPDELPAVERAVGAHGRSPFLLQSFGNRGHAVPHEREISAGVGIEGQGDEHRQGRGRGPGGPQGGQGFPKIVLGLDDQEIRPAPGERPRLLGERVFELRFRELALGLEELAGRTDASADEPAGRRRFPGDAGGGGVQLRRAGFESVGGELDPAPAEAVGRNGVGPRFVIARVDGLDGLRPLRVPGLGARPLRQAARDELRAQAAVEENGPLADKIEDGSLHSGPHL